MLAGNGGNPLLFLAGIAAGVSRVCCLERMARRWPYRARLGVRLRFCVAAGARAGLFWPFSVVRPIFLARYLNPCLPALGLVVAAGIIQLRRPAPVWLLGLAFSGLSLLGTFSFYRQDFDLLYRDDWRTATSYVLDRALPGDGAFFYANFGRLPFEFYRSQKTAPLRPGREALVSANGADWGYRNSLFAYMADSIREAGSGSDRVWLVLDLDTDVNGKPNLQSTILRGVYGKGRHLVEEKRISTITIVLFARDVEATRSRRWRKAVGLHKFRNWRCDSGIQGLRRWARAPHKGELYLMLNFSMSHSEHEPL